MKKIIIHGSTLGSNFGDCLFAKLFYDRCESKNKGGNLFYENKLPIHNDAVAFSKEFRTAINYQKKCTFRDVLSCDGMIFMAGGYFGETTKSNKEALLRFYKHIKLGLYAILLKKPLAIIGVGAGPLSHGFMRWGTRVVFNHASHITVRNEESKEFLESVGVMSEIHVSADAAQIIVDNTFPYIEFKEKKEIREKTKNKKLILVHCVTPVNQILEMKQRVIPALKQFLDETEYGVVFTDDQCSSDRTEQLTDLANALDKEAVYIYKYKNPQELIELIKICDVVLTTKLHVGIVSCTLGKPVVSFPFNSTKIERYYNQIGEGDRCVPIRNVTADIVFEKLCKYYNQPVYLSEKIKAMARLNFEMVDNFIDSL